MTWLWLAVTWIVLACAAAVWLGAAMRTAARNDAVRVEVEDLTEGPTGEPGRQVRGQPNP